MALSLDEMVSRMRENDVRFDRERLDFLIEEKGVRKPVAVALILTENGYSHSGIASIIDMTDSTAKGYLEELEEDLGEAVTDAHPKSEPDSSLWPDDYQNPYDK